jgi:hypothetical protein
MAENESRLNSVKADFNGDNVFVLNRLPFGAMGAIS